jgi:hypothetical protein
MADYYSRERKSQNGRVQHSYVALGDADEAGNRKQAEISAISTPVKFLPNFDNTEKSGFSEHAHEKADKLYAENWGSDPDSDSYSSGYNTNHPYFQQDTLFDTIPSNTEIYRMFADPSMSSTALTMAQLAKNKTKSEVLSADYDLSPHSSKLVQHAASRGLVQPSKANPEAKPKNDIEKVERWAGRNEVDYYKEKMQPVTQGEVLVAQNDVRQSLRNSRKRSNTPVTKKGLSNQFLPGMEGFI